MRDGNFSQDFERASLNEDDYFPGDSASWSDHSPRQEAAGRIRNEPYRRENGRHEKRHRREWDHDQRRNQDRNRRNQDWNRRNQDRNRRKRDEKPDDYQVNAVKKKTLEDTARKVKMRRLQGAAYVALFITIILDIVALLSQWGTCGTPPSPLCERPFSANWPMVIIGLLILLSIVVAVGSIVCVIKGVAAHDEKKKKFVRSIDGASLAGVLLRLAAIVVFVVAAFGHDKNGIQHMTVGFICICIAIVFHVIASMLALVSFTYSGATTIFSNRVIKMPRPIQVEIDTPNRKKPILVDISIAPSHAVE